MASSSRRQEPTTIPTAVGARFMKAILIYSKDKQRSGWSHISAHAIIEIYPIFEQLVKIKYGSNDYSRSTMRMWYHQETRKMLAGKKKKDPVDRTFLKNWINDNHNNIKKNSLAAIQGQSALETLPQEMFSHIMSFLNPKDILKTRQVSRSITEKVGKMEKELQKRLKNNKVTFKGLKDLRKFASKV